MVHEQHAWLDVVGVARPVDRHGDPSHPASRK
jgi:hypothetical protein